MSALWSGRFDEGPDPDVFAFGASFAIDRRLFEDDVTGSVAWVRALADAGAVSPADAATISGALSEILAAGRADPGFVSGDDEDVHSFVERQLIARVGDVGKRLHTGRSRNEQVSVDLRLYLLRRLPVLQQAVVDLARTLLGQAERAGETLMPSYTHLRRAQPILVAHFWLAHLAALQRDHERLAGAAREADALPLGSGAVAGTSYAIDTRTLAARLGFTRVVANSLDAASDRDFVSTFLCAAAQAMVHLSRLAEDLIVFGTEEFGFVELDDRVATGSSLMPQKKNPDPLELIRGKAGRTIGGLTGWLSTIKSLPSGYNKDLQEDKEAVFNAEDTLLACLLACATVVETADVDKTRLERAASGFMLATDVADYLVARGLPFRAAHELVGTMVRQLLAEGREFATLTPADWRGFSPLFDEDVTSRITARTSVEAKRTPQSTRPAAVAAALDAARSWIASVDRVSG